MWKGNMGKKKKWRTMKNVDSDDDLFKLGKVDKKNMKKASMTKKRRSHKKSKKGRRAQVTAPARV